MLQEATESVSLHLPGSINRAAADICVIVPDARSR